MGYTTDFNGRFNLDKPLDDETYKLLKGLAETRRMARNIKGYGVEGEFYIEGQGFMGQDRDSTVIDSNTPPKTQPSLWLQWTPTADKQGLEWDGGEKFYEYVQWLEYLIDSILKPRGYVLNGVVQYRGEDFDDNGSIEVIDNKVKQLYGKLKPVTTKLIEKPKPKKVVSKKNAKTKNENGLELVGHFHNGKYYIESESLMACLVRMGNQDLSASQLKGWIKELTAKKA